MGAQYTGTTAIVQAPTMYSPGEALLGPGRQHAKQLLVGLPLRAYRLNAHVVRSARQCCSMRARIAFSSPQAITASISRSEPPPAKSESLKPRRR
jgi:hypothetical protein